MARQYPQPNPAGVRQPSFSPDPGRNVSVVSAGTVSKPKAYHVGRLGPSVPSPRVVPAPGVGTV